MADPGGVVRRRVRDVPGRASRVEPRRAVRVADVGHMAGDGRCALAAMIMLAAAPSAVLLHRNAFGPAWLSWLIVSLAAVSAIGVLWPRPPVVALVAGCLAGLAGTTAFSIATAATPHHGTIPTAIRPSGVAGAWMNDEG